MITIQSQPSGRYFSSAVPDVKFSISGGYANVIIASADTQLMSETYYPDSSGSITLRDMPSLLNAYAMQSGYLDITITITEYTIADGVASQTDTQSFIFSVIYANADVQVPADDFLANHFLSVLLGDKLTAVGRIEYLYAYDCSSVTVIAEYYTASDGVTTENISVDGTGANHIFAFNVSANKFVRSDKKLIRYTVSADARSQTYVIDGDNPDCAPILLFTNSFGCQELLYCTGTHEVAPEYSHSATYQNGLYLDYDIDETRLFKANTGVMTVPMANWADDLFRSREVYLFVDGAPDKRITITESKSERSNDIDSLPVFTFNYRYAQRQQNVLQLKHPGRVFDNTFDRTFQ